MNEINTIETYPYRFEEPKKWIATHDRELLGGSYETETFGFFEDLDGAMNFVRGYERAALAQDPGVLGGFPDDDEPDLLAALDNFEVQDFEEFGWRFSPVTEVIQVN